MCLSVYQWFVLYKQSISLIYSPLRLRTLGFLLPQDTAWYTIPCRQSRGGTTEYYFPFYLLPDCRRQLVSLPVWTRAEALWVLEDLGLAVSPSNLEYPAFLLASGEETLFHSHSLERVKFSPQDSSLALCPILYVSPLPSVKKMSYWIYWMAMAKPFIEMESTHHLQQTTRETSPFSTINNPGSQPTVKTDWQQARLSQWQSWKLNSNFCYHSAQISRTWLITGSSPNLCPHFQLSTNQRKSNMLP